VSTEDIESSNTFFVLLNWLSNQIHWPQNAKIFYMKSLIRLGSPSLRLKLQDYCR